MYLMAFEALTIEIDMNIGQKNWQPFQFGSLGERDKNTPNRFERQTNISSSFTSYTYTVYSIHNYHFPNVNSNETKKNGIERDIDTYDLEWEEKNITTTENVWRKYAKSGTNIGTPRTK